jgi:hypothetical protein
VTFGAFADQLVPELAKGFRNDKHIQQWSSTLTTYAASLRSKPVAQIGTDDILAVLQPIWTAKSETASRLRGRIERILDAARAKGLRTVRTQLGGAATWTTSCQSESASPGGTMRRCRFRACRISLQTSEGGPAQQRSRSNSSS